MYLPHEIQQAQVLISVKTYPLPSGKYDELVCTAGFLSDGKWIRLYPIPFRAIPYSEQYEKYHWITLDVVKNPKDFRPESYRPKKGVDDIHIGEKLDTTDNWAKRKEFALNEVFISMEELVKRAKSDEGKSLAMLQPSEIIDFVIEPTDREWKRQWQDQLLQFNLFDRNEKGEGVPRQVVPKLPYKYFYKFLTKGDQKPRQLMIEDWEIGALYWRCYYQHGRNEREANRLVRQKFFDEFCSKKELYFFLGTSLQYHNIAPQPFMIIGVFYPPKPKQRPLTIQSPDKLNIQELHQGSLFEE